MARSLSLLDDVRISSPCSASWEAMDGTDRVRRCDQCGLDVYNLSALTREAAEELLRTREGRLCVRLFRRSDGTVLTRDCPVGLDALRRDVRRAGAFVLARLGAMLVLMLGLLGLVFGEKSQGDWAEQLRKVEPFKTVLDRVAPLPPTPMVRPRPADDDCVMGRFD
jgi:hypothetical protein